MGVTNFDDYKDVFVVADTIDDVVHPVTYELIGQARRIAKELGREIATSAEARKLCCWANMFNPKQKN